MQSAVTGVEWLPSMTDEPADSLAAHSQHMEALTASLGVPAELMREQQSGSYSGAHAALAAWQPGLTGATANTAVTEAAVPDAGFPWTTEQQEAVVQSFQNAPRMPTVRTTPRQAGRSYRASQQERLNEPYTNDDRSFYPHESGRGSGYDRRAHARRDSWDTIARAVLDDLETLADQFIDENYGRWPTVLVLKREWVLRLGWRGGENIVMNVRPGGDSIRISFVILCDESILLPTFLNLAHVGDYVPIHRRRGRARAQRQRVDQILLDQLSAPPTAESQAAVDAINDFTRMQLREEGAVRTIMPPREISDDELDRYLATAEIQDSESTVQIRNETSNSDELVVAIEAMAARLASTPVSPVAAAVTQLPSTFRPQIPRKRQLTLSGEKSE